MLLTLSSCQTWWSPQIRKAVQPAEDLVQVVSVARRILVRVEILHATTIRVGAISMERTVFARLTDHEKRKRITTGFLVAACLVCLAGCSRSFWRRQAEEDSYQAIAERMVDPRWAVPRFDITPDPRSRFFDPYDPDCAPLPPDDPAAHKYMHWVDGWQGYKSWHKFGDLMTVENPQWMSYFGLSPEMIDPVTGEYVAPVPAIENLALRDAIELSLIHNRQYQMLLEDIFLQALNVTAERFQFGVRYLGFGREPGFVNTNTVGEDVSRFGIGSDFGIQQTLPFGATWILELANDVVWNFNGQNNFRSITGLSYRIVQPLLADAGRKINLESLTDAERQLLYDVRTLARFRKDLFADVVSGPSGYLGLLAQLQGIRNQQDNIRRTEEQVERLLAQASRGQEFARVDLEQFPPGVQIPDELSGPEGPRPTGLQYNEELKGLFWRGPISDEQIEILRNLSPDPEFQRAVEEMVSSLRTEVAPLDVLSLQSELTNSINSLRTQEQRFQDSLDRFKILLGLPPDMYMTIDDGLLQPFAVIDVQLIDIEEEIKDFVEVWGELDEEMLLEEDLTPALQEFAGLVRKLETEGISIVAGDLDKVREALPGRLESIEDEQQRQQVEVDFQPRRTAVQQSTRGPE